MCFTNASYCSQKTHTQLSGTAPQRSWQTFVRQCNIAWPFRAVISTATKAVVWPCEAGKLPWYVSSLSSHNRRWDAGWQLQSNSYHSHLCSSMTASTNVWMVLAKKLKRKSRKFRFLDSSVRREKCHSECIAMWVAVFKTWQCLKILKSALLRANICKWLRMQWRKWIWSTQ